MSKVLSCPECISNHTIMEHLFVSPLCEDQELLVKIAVVVFHILTFGVPLAVYHVIDCIFPRADQPSIRAQDQMAQRMQELVSTSIPQRSKLGDVTYNAVVFAKQELGKRPDIRPYDFGSSVPHGPTNPEISRMFRMYQEVQKPAFFAALSKYTPEEAWNQEEVLQAADALMKVAYAISNSTVEDLAEFTKRLKNSGDERTKAYALSRLDSYCYTTFYTLPLAYHLVRGAFWTGGEGSARADCWSAGREPRGGLGYEIPHAHAKPFYEEGTGQRDWRVLYNAFSMYFARAVQTADDSELERIHDEVQVKWTHPDTGRGSFLTLPASYPFRSY
ncbi:MAG: hypothetical protein HYX48_06395 [Chlamydiales bacterium]|nr:hypothetical protein [Chlamydiales bacterium]